MRLFTTMLSLGALMAALLALPAQVQAHCGSCGTGDEKPTASADHGHDHAEKVKKDKYNFALKDAEGNTHKLSDHRGEDKVVVVVWTNPDCPFIVRHYEEKTFNKLAKAYSDQPVAMFLIDSTHNGTAERTVKNTEKYDLSVPVLHDPTGKVGKAYDAKRTPEVYIFDKEGELVYQGAVDDDPRGSKSADERVNYVDKVVSALLKGEKAPVTSTKAYGCTVKYPAKEAAAADKNNEG